MTTHNQKTIVEINGVKLEVDLRTAKTVEEYRVGDTVKLLKKEYGDSYKSYAGMIVGFDPFISLPTIIVAYIDQSYSGVDIKFDYLNAKSEGVEICHTDSLERLVKRLRLTPLVGSRKRRTSRARPGR
jgi:ribosomal protein L19